MGATGALGTPGRDQSSAPGGAATGLLLGASHHSWARRAPSCERIPSGDPGASVLRTVLAMPQSCCISPRLQGHVRLREVGWLS